MVRYHLTALSGVDLFLFASGVLLWMALITLAALPLLAPRRVPLVGPGWNIKRFQGAFLFLLLVTLFVWRMPELLYAGPTDVDECQFLSVAQRFMTDGVAWRAGDSSTVGPLDCYLLTWAGALSLPFNFQVAGFTGLACVSLTLLMLLRSVSLVVGRRRSLPIVLAAATFYYFGWHYDDVRYAGEHLPVALIATAGWLILLLRRRPASAYAFVIGLLLGAVPFAKLQAGVIAIYLFAVATAIVLTLPVKRFASPRHRIRMLVALVIGGAFVPILIMTPVIVTGTWPDFWERYILLGLRYKHSMLFNVHPTYLQSAWWCAKVNPFLTALVLFSVIVAGVKFGLRSGRVDRTWALGWGIIGGYLAVSIFVILKTQMPFFHYLLLLVCPAVLLAAWTLRGRIGAEYPAFLKQKSATLALGLLAVCVIPQVINYGLHFSEHPRLTDEPVADPVTPAIRAVTHPGDTLGIWGWTPQYFILTGLASATRDVIGFSVLMPSSDGDYYRGCFLADFKKSKPKVFIDSVGTTIYPDGWPHPVEKARYTMYPELAAYIDSNYHLKTQVSATAETPPVLIFVRNDGGGD